MHTLQAINVCLAAIGEEPAQSRDEGDYYVGLAESAIGRALSKYLVNGWHFNTDEKTYTPNSDGEIELASDEIGIAFPSNLEDRLTIRDGKVWDRENRAFYGTEFDGLSVRDIAFEKLPEPFAEWIAREAAVELVFQQDGLTPEFQVAQAMANRAKAAALNSERYTLNNFSGFGLIRAAHSL